jgi:hypothetical protein
MIMKKLVCVLILVIGTVFFAVNRTSGQAVVIKDGINVNLVTTYETVPSVSCTWVNAPSGNILLKIIWQFSKENPLIPELGVNKISVGGSLARDEETLVFPDGKVIGIFHVNGQQETKVLRDDGCISIPCVPDNVICGSAIKEIKYWNNTLHLKFYGDYIGESTDFHYSMSGICIERIQYSGQIITVPIQVKMENELIAVAQVKWGVIIDINGEVELDDSVAGTTIECK